MKGIVLAGGTGSRLFPLTLGVSKQLLPVYDKPMIFYPLSVLMLAGIQDILLICTPQDEASFRRVFGDGSAFGIRISYQLQQHPDGIAQALLLGEQFLGDDAVTLVLGDNFFYGAHFREALQRASGRSQGATLFACQVHNPQRYGVVAFDAAGNPAAIVEKPAQPPSPFAVTGLYCFDNSAVAKAKTLIPSARGELEITDLNNLYLAEQTLTVEKLGRGFAWLDTGTPESLLEASLFVQTIEHRQGLKIACLEEIAWQHGWLDLSQLQQRADFYGKTPYGDYLRQLVTEHS